MASALDRYKGPILTGFVLGLSLLFDIAARQIRDVLPSPAPQPTIENQYRIEHPDYHHALEPNFQTDEALWGARYPIRTNSLGFKDRSVREVPLAADGRRLMLLGDSFTEGLGVAFEDTFAGRVQDALAPEVAVLNGAVSSYAPTIHRAFVNHWLDQGLELDELIVFLDPSDAEDDQWFYRYDTESETVVEGRGTYILSGGYKTWLERNTLLTAVLIDGVRQLLRPEPEANVWAWRSAWAWDRAAYADHGAGAQRGAEHMSALAERCREADIALRVVIYPWPDAIWHQRTTDRYTEHWTAWAASEGVPLLNLYPRFQQDPSVAGIDALFLAGDVHWNEAGHAVVAEELLEWRASLGP